MARSESEPIDTTLRDVRAMVARARTVGDTYPDWLVALLRDLADGAEGLANYIGQPLSDD